MNTPSGISIVIPTEGRTSLTIALIEQLYGLRERVEFPTEVLIIDSSQTDTQQKILTACEHYDAIFIPGSPNVRSKRNAGIRHAQFSVILFLDSDCSPSENLLTEHWKYYENHPGLLISGVLGKLEFTGQKTLAWYFVEHSSMVRHFDIAEKPTYVRWGPTANLSVRRDVLIEIGLFDENFPFKLGGDDLDLTYRITQSGRSLIYNPFAIALHSRSTWNSISAVLGRAMRWGRMEYHLYKKHKALRVHHPPTLFAWFIAVCVLFLICGFVFEYSLFLLFPIVWLFLATSLFSFISALQNPGSYTDKFSSFKENVLSTIPELTYQVGSSLEFLRHGDLRFFYSRPLLSVGETKGSWIPEAINTWSNLLALLICYSLMIILIGQS